jgi:large subunit ribosomal protein L20
MSRAKRGVKGVRRRNALLSQTRGFVGRRKNVHRIAHETFLRAGVYAYAGRRLRRRDMRGLWIQRINAAAREAGLTYSKFVNLLKQAGVVLDRKALANLAFSDPVAFKAVVDTAKAKGRVKA